MSYRLITKAILTMGESSTDIEIRAYAAPKGEAKGKVEFDGKQVPFKLTSGAGRGQATKYYVYIPHGDVSAYFEVNVDQFAAFKANVSGISIKSATVSAPVEAPKTEEKPAVKAKRRKVAEMEDAPI